MEKKIKLHKEMLNKDNKFKETQLGFIPKEWKIQKFSELTINFDNKRQPVSSMQRAGRTGAYPYYGASGVVDYIDDYIFDEKLLLISEDGENLKTRKTPIAFFADGKYWVNNHAHVVKNKSDVDLRFIKYWFDANSISQYLSGSVQPKLSRSNLDSIQIVTPPLVAQRSISDVLSSLDDEIELNRKINFNLEKIVSALFKRWFIDFEFPDKNGKPYKTAGGKMILSELGDIPEGWKAGSLKDICNLNPFYKLEKRTFSRYTEMKDLPETGLSIKDPVKREFIAGAKFINGDTLLARITPCLENGKTGYVNFLVEGEVGWGSTEFIVMHPIKIEFSEMLYILARSREFREHAIGSMSGTSGRQRVQISSLINYRLFVPSDSVIVSYHLVASALFSKIRLNKIQIDKLTMIRDALLLRLMSGKIRV